MCVSFFPSFFLSKLLNSREPKSTKLIRENFVIFGLFLMSRGTNVAIVDSLWKDCCDCGYFVEKLLQLWIFCGKIVVVVDISWNGFNNFFILFFLLN